MVVREKEEFSFAPTYRYEIGHYKECGYKQVKKTGRYIEDLMWGLRGDVEVEGKKEGLSFAPTYKYEKGHWKEYA